MVLENKVALVTGGSRGIGAAIVVALAKEGATVCINYQRNKEKAKIVLAEIQNISKKNHCLIPFDVSSYSEVEKGIDHCAKETGSIDILVNNAGITRDNLLLRMKEEEWDEVIQTNLKGVFNCSKAAAKWMLKKKWGRIINIASLSGEMGNAGQCNYSASKAGMIGFTKSLAKELATRNITVNAVSPGFIETEMTGHFSSELKEELIKKIPMRRFGTCEEVAHLVVFLAAEHASYLTGQVIGINGGFGI